MEAIDGFDFDKNNEDTWPTDYTDALIKYEYAGQHDWMIAWWDDNAQAWRYRCECEDKDMPLLEDDWHYNVYWYRPLEPIAIKP